MVYQNKFVAVVKSNGKILREQGENVYLNFGSEYSILLKNLDSRDAKVNISIDGQDVLYGSSLIIEGNSKIELKGKLQENSVRNRFKFIQKTEKIQDHRGDRIDDGIIRIEYAYEKREPKKKIIIHEHHYHNDHHYNWPIFRGGAGYGGINDNFTLNSTSDVRGDSTTLTSIGGNVNCNSFAYSSLGIEESSKPMQEEGITVNGSQVSQDFSTISFGETEKSEIIIIRLKGVISSGKIVKKPITIKTKIKCSTCGKLLVSSSKFCNRCGTSLV